MEESGPSTSNNAETPASTVSEPTSDMIDNTTFFKNLRFPAYEPKVKKVLYLCAEEDEKWAKKVGWKNIFPEELQDHSYCNPGQTEKYKPRPDELPEPETKDMEPIYAEDEVRKPNEHFLEEEHISPRVAGHRLLAMNGEVLESGSVTPHNQRPVPSQVRSRVPILPQPPHRMTPVGLDPRVPIQTGRAPLIVPARGRTLSRSQDVVLPDNHMTLQRNSMSPMKTNVSEIGVPLHPDGVTRTNSPQKVRIIRQNPERSSHLAVRQPAIIPQNVTRARALEREEVLPPDIAATALDLLSEHLAVAAAVDPTDQYKDMNAETMKMEIDSIRRKLQTDTLGNAEGVRQPRLQSPPMRRLTSPPQGGRHRTTSTSSNSSIPGTVRTGALIRHPGSPPLRVPMDGVRVQPAIGTPSMRHGVKSNLKKTVVPQQPMDAVEPSRRSSRARNSTTKKDEQEEKMRCLCGVTTDTPKGEPWVSCDRCGVWQHQFCAGFKSRKGANYLCDECEDPVNRRKRPSEQESIAYINARIKKFGPGDKVSDDEEEEDVDKPLRGADRKHQTRRETAATTPVRGTVTKNVRSLLTVAGTGNNFTGPKMLTTCAKMNVANDHTPGIVAQCSIAPGTAVIEIVANLCIPADIDKPKSYNPHIFYYDGLVDQKAALTTAQKQENQICLDARKFALDGKFVRRCCRPNSTIKHIYASNQVNFYVVTRQQINIQDEITVPFEAGFKPTRRDQCRCIPDSGCLLDTGSFIGPGFCDLSPVRSLPLKSPPKSPISQTAASPTRRFVSPPRQPIQQEVAVEEVKAREEKSEEETPAPRSARRGRIQSTSKKASETEEVKTEEIKEERNEEMKETPQEDPVAKKKSPVKQETPKRTAPKKKPSFPKSELDELLALQNNVHFDVDFKQKESREQRKAREMFERMEKESARKAALEQAKDKTKVSATTSKAAQKTPKATPKAVKKEMEQEETPSRRTRSQTDDMPTTSKVEVKEVAAEPISEQMEKSPSPSKSMSAPKKMFQHRYNQEKAAEPQEPVSKRSRRSEAKVEAHTFDISKELAASLKILEKKLKNEDYTLPADCLKYVPKKSEPTVKKAKAVSKRKTPKETVSIEPEVVPKKGKAVEVKEEKTVPERSRKKSESKTKVVEKKKEEPKTEVKTEEDNEKEPEPLIEEPVPEPAPITERPRRSINLEEYKKRRAERPVDEEPTELKRKSFMPDFNNVPQTVTLPDLPLGYIDQKQLEREILGLPSTRTPSSSTRQSMRSSSSAAQPSTTSSMTSPAERKERGLLRDRLAQLFSQDPLLNPQSSSSSPSDPRIRRSRFTE